MKANPKYSMVLMQEYGEIILLENSDQHETDEKK
jgi:hypothetical protein